jgi:ankyrin repeat protein
VKQFSYVMFAVVSLAAFAAPAAAQMGTAGYQGLTFVQAVKDRDGAKALEALGDNPTPAILNARDGDGNTALIIAVARRDPEWTGFLLNKGADPNLAGKSGETALIAASRIGFDEAVGWLLSMGAKVDATNRMGETALITAVVQRQPTIVRQLLQAGADPDKTDTAAGYSAREYAQRDNRARDIQQMIQAKKPKPAAAH